MDASSEFAWPSTAAAHRFAFGDDQALVGVTTVTLLHKDRIDEIAGHHEDPQPFEGRWRGVRGRAGAQHVAFVATPGGSSDVVDCVLHLSARPFRAAIYTGTCGTLRDELPEGAVCIATEGWLAGDVHAFLADPGGAVRDARSTRAPMSKAAAVIAKALARDYGLNVRRVRVLTVPSQARESGEVLAAVCARGAEVLDLEASCFLAATEMLGLPSVALMWCTDRPLQRSFYSSTAAPEICGTRWRQWPSIVATASATVAAELS